MLISKKTRDTLTVKNTIQIEGTEIPTTIKTVVTVCQQKENGWATYGTFHTKSDKKQGKLTSHFFKFCNFQDTFRNRTQPYG